MATDANALAKVPCPHCRYRAGNQGSIDAHVSMMHGDQMTLLAEPSPLSPEKEARIALVVERASKTARALRLMPDKGVEIIPARGDSREDWLLRAVELLRPLFAEADIALPEKVRVSVGWPGGRGKKRNVIGQCWAWGLTEDGIAQLFISPILVDPAEVLATLAHELCHAAGKETDHHRAPFVRRARAIGLLPPWTATSAGPELAERLHALAGELGPYDHGKLNPKGRQVVQTTRMLKVVCGTCGCVVRMTRKWLDEPGAPRCGCGAPEGMEEA